MDLLKKLGEFIMELFFDHKDEYTFSSNKFNLRKVGVFIIVVLSISLNVFLTSSYFKLGGKYLELRKELTESKNNSKASSDSQNPIKK